LLWLKKVANTQNLFPLRKPSAAFACPFFSLMNYKITYLLFAVTILLLLSTGHGNAQCNQQYNWTTWQTFPGKSATGVINNNGTMVNVTMTSNFIFGSTSVIFGYFNFAGFGGGLPNSTVPATQWSAGAGGTTTMCFDQVVKNPVLVFSSLGAVGAPVTLHFSVPYQVLYTGINMTYANDTTLTGAEGYDVLLFPGDFTCLTIFSTTPENYTNITWGLNPPLFAVNIAGNPQNCDSVSLTASGGSSYSWSGGTSPKTATNTFTASGTYFLTVTDANNCTVTTSATVVVNHSSSSSSTVSICEGNSYNGHTVSGSYTDTLQNAAGCDSFRTLTLNVIPKVRYTINKTICQGDSWLGYTATGIYPVDSLISAEGCDSIVTLNLLVNPSFNTNIQQTICAGESYFGHQATGNYTDVFKSSTGCDSTRNLDLTVLARSYSDIRQTICEGEAYDGYQLAGDYTDTLKSANGCDSVRTLHLTVNAASFTTINHTICQGDSYMGYTVTGTYKTVTKGSNGCDSTTTLNLTVTPATVIVIDKRICEGESFLGYTSTGTYTDLFKSLSGCDSTRTLQLTVNTTQVSTISKTICEGDSFFGYTQGGNYAIKLKTTEGCDSIINLTISVVKNCMPRFPNVFSPNGDGNNDSFGILSNTPLQNFVLSIYNRWGQRLFVTNNYKQYWDGRFNGKLQTPDAYVYTCSFIINGSPMQMKGFIIITY
jgi:gliding motility-associated-like protein